MISFLSYEWKKILRPLFLTLRRDETWINLEYSVDCHERTTGRDRRSSGTAGKQPGPQSITLRKETRRLH